MFTPYIVELKLCRASLFNGVEMKPNKRIMGEAVKSIRKERDKWTDEQYKNWCDAAEFHDPLWWIICLGTIGFILAFGCGLVVSLLLLIALIPWFIMLSILG